MKNGQLKMSAENSQTKRTIIKRLSAFLKLRKLLVKSQKAPSPFNQTLEETEAVLKSLV